MKAEISRIFHEHAHYHHGEWAVAPKKVGPMIVAIAALVEDEKAIIETAWITKCAKLEARLAEMVRMWESLKADCEECGAPDDVEITGGYGLDIGLVWELCNEALAAGEGGRVLWEGEGEIIQYPSRFGYPGTTLFQMDTKKVDTSLEVYEHYGKNGQRVRVTVTAIEEPPADAEEQMASE